MSLVNVLPLTPANYCRDHRLANAELPGQIFLAHGSAHIALSNIANLVLCQLRMRTQFAAALGLRDFGLRCICSYMRHKIAFPATTHRILLSKVMDDIDVVRRERMPLRTMGSRRVVPFAVHSPGHRLKMRGIRASFVFAPVMRLVRPFPVGQEVRNTMVAPGVTGFATPVKGSVGRTLAQPRPTGIWAGAPVHPGPKSFNVFWGKIRMHRDRLHNRLIGVPRLGMLTHRRGLSCPPIIAQNPRHYRHFSMQGGV